MVRCALRWVQDAQYGRTIPALHLDATHAGFQLRTALTFLLLHHTVDLY